MDIYEKIRVTLKSEYDSGKTYREISERSNVPSQHVHSLINGKSKIERMELYTFFKLFPRAKIILPDENMQMPDPLETEMNDPMLGMILDRWKYLSASDKGILVDQVAKLTAAKKDSIFSPGKSSVKEA